MAELASERVNRWLQTEGQNNGDNNNNNNNNNNNTGYYLIETKFCVSAYPVAQSAEQYRLNTYIYIEIMDVVEKREKKKFKY